MRGACFSNSFNAPTLIKPSRVSNHDLSFSPDTSDLEVEMRPKMRSYLLAMRFKKSLHSRSYGTIF